MDDGEIGVQGWSYLNDPFSSCFDLLLMLVDVDWMIDVLFVVILVLDWLLRPSKLEDDCFKMREWKLFLLEIIRRFQRDKLDRINKIVCNWWKRVVIQFCINHSNRIQSRQSHPIIQNTTINSSVCNLIFMALLNILMPWIQIQTHIHI